MDKIIKRMSSMTMLLSEVICDIEYDGQVNPPTYIKIKRIF